MGSGFFGEQMVHHIKLVCTQSAEKIVQTMNTLVVSCVLTALLIKEGTTWGQRRPPVPKQTGTLQGHIYKWNATSSPVNFNNVL